MIAAKTGAPVVPVLVTGSYKAFPKGAKFPNPTPIEIRIGQPLLLQRDTGEERPDYELISRQTLQAIAALGALKESTNATV
jgi:1-acyl-sn-glycerol-3-phosphate acyltransferase